MENVKICEMHSTFVCFHIYCALLYMTCKYYIISVGLAEMGSKELTLKAGIPGHWGIWSSAEPEQPLCSFITNVCMVLIKI